MNNPLVSISIPTYNSAGTIQTTLEAILKQDYKNFEIIIVDSYSKDTTLEICKKYTNKIFLTSEKLLGARKLGLQKSEGQYILLLDSDQVLSPTALSRSLSLIKETGAQMLFLEEKSFDPKTWIEKFFDMDRKLIHETYQEDPLTGVLLPRLYEKRLLSEAMRPIPQKELEICVAQDHAIIFYEASKLSDKTALLPDAVRHIEPSSLINLIKKNYRYGKTCSEIKLFKKEYQDMISKKQRFRKFHLKYLKEYLASSVILVIKGVPFYIGKYL